jgi:capsular exopolysaccharide synthesis family protein
MNRGQVHNSELPSDYEPFDTEHSGLEVRELLRRLWGYKWLIAVIMALGVGGTWIMVQQLVPRYTATAVLMIEPPKKNIINLQEVVEGLDTRPQTIRSEVVVLQSRGLAAKAVEKLHLYDSPRLNAPRKEKSFFAHLNPVRYLGMEWKGWIRDFIRDAKASISGKPEKSELPRLESSEEAHKNAVVSRFLAGLSVSREQYTKIVRVSFTAEDPRLAADAANALADVYVRNTLEVKYAGTREAAQWLTEQLDELRGRVEETEAAAERIRQGEALVQGRGAQVAREQISQINRQLLLASSETAGLRARLKQIERLRESPDWAERSGTLLGSQMIQRLRTDLLQLERKDADLALELGDKHPKLINVRVEISEGRKKLQEEFEMIVEATRNKLAVAQVHEHSLERNLDVITNQAGDVNESALKLRALEREAEANRSLFETFLTRAKETRIQQEVQQPDARVISYAQVPGAPSYPPKDEYMTTAFVLALGLALGLIYAIGMLDNGFRTAQQVTRLTGLPVLALLPQASLKGEKAKYVEDLITNNSHTRFAESVNMLYSNLKWPRDGGPSKSILISSAMPKEGKTSTATSLVRRAALLGDKALLIDCDFRNPRATQELGLSHSPGLAEVVAGEARLEDALQFDEVSGASVLSCGRSEINPIALIGSEGFRSLLEKLKQRFDFIIIDSSPILAVAEPQILARAVDQTVVVVRWGKTPRKVAATAISQLQEYGARVSGATLAQVDVTKQRYYGYGEYGYYTNQIKNYYSN